MPVAAQPRLLVYNINKYSGGRYSTGGYTDSTGRCIPYVLVLLVLDVDVDVDVELVFVYLISVIRQVVEAHKSSSLTRSSRFHFTLLARIT